MRPGVAPFPAVYSTPKELRETWKRWKTLIDEANSGIPGKAKLLEQALEATRAENLRQLWLE